MPSFLYFLILCWSSVFFPYALKFSEHFYDHCFKLCTRYITFSHFIRFFFFLEFHFVLLFETQSAVFLFCLPFCVCLHALGEAVTSPFLEGVSLRRSVFRQTVCVHWLWWKGWSWSDHGLLLVCTGGDCSPLKLGPGVGFRLLLGCVEGYHFGTGAGARGVGFGAQHEPRFLLGCARDCCLGRGTEVGTWCGWGVCGRPCRDSKHVRLLPVCCCRAGPGSEGVCVHSL